MPSGDLGIDTENVPSVLTVDVPITLPFASITLAVCDAAPSFNGTEPVTTVSALVISAALGLPTNGEVL